MLQDREKRASRALVLNIFRTAFWKETGRKQKSQNMVSFHGKQLEKSAEGV